jgi:type II secretory pathway component GspD/PulD (secretin)
MKNTSLIIVTCLIVLASCPIHAQDTNKVSGTIAFENVPVSDVLDVYKALTKQVLVISPDVSRATHGITLHAEVVSVEKTQRLIEETLLKQAGVVLTHLDNNRVSVTYNEHLKLQP